MKTEKIYEQLLAYIEQGTRRYAGSEAADDLVWAREQIDHPNSGVDYSKNPYEIPVFGLVGLMLDLKEQMNRESAKAAGRADTRNAMLRVIKGVGEYQRRTMGGAFVQDGKQTVCDGYRAIRLNDAIDLPVPEYPEQAPKMKPIFDGAMQNSDPLDLPDLGELKAHIKAQKAEQTARGIRRSEQKIVWDFGDGKPMVDASYLADMIEALPNAEAYGKGLNGMIYFRAENGDGVLCGVRKSA